jgi:hypothetical protein
MVVSARALSLISQPIQEPTLQHSGIYCLNITGQRERAVGLYVFKFFRRWYHREISEPIGQNGTCQVDLCGDRKGHLSYSIPELLAESWGLGRAPRKTLRQVAFFFFQKKKQKALFRFAEGCGLPKLRRSRPRGSGGVPPAKLYVKQFFLSVNSASRKAVDYSNFGEADSGGWRHAPSKTLR